MSECTHNCSTCGESCGERTSPQSFLKKPHADAHIGKVFGVVSGKGGVGKSMVTSQLAVSLRRKGYRVGILDADITGPSIPKAFGMHEKAVGTENALLPCVSSTGIEVMSINLLLDDETDPVIWRGPVIGGVLDRRPLGCRLPPRRYAAGHRRRDAERLSVHPALRHRGRRLPAGACRYGGGEGREDGGEDGGPHRRPCGEHELSRLSRLRQKNLPLRRG